jgi:hypothetical protein
MDFRPGPIAQFSMRGDLPIFPLHTIPIAYLEGLIV